MVLSDVAPTTSRSERRLARPSAGDSAAPTRAYLTAEEPWTARTGLFSLALALAGSAVVVICWDGASDLRTAEDQASWLVGSIAGTVIFGFAGAVWVISGFRAVRLGLHQLARDKRAFALAGKPEPTGAVAHSGLVIGAGMARMHRADCLLVQGKQVRPVGMADDGLPGCGVCLS